MAWRRSTTATISASRLPKWYSAAEVLCCWLSRTISRIETQFTPRSANRRSAASSSACRVWPLRATLTPRRAVAAAAGGGGRAVCCIAE
jgi:hypothetical protein